MNVQFAKSKKGFYLFPLERKNRAIEAYARLTTMADLPKPPRLIIKIKRMIKNREERMVKVCLLENPPMRKSVPKSIKNK